MMDDGRLPIYHAELRSSLAQLGMLFSLTLELSRAWSPSSFSRTSMWNQTVVDTLAWCKRVWNILTYQV
jgi:hypothetical protein